MKKLILTKSMLKKYLDYLRSQEKSIGTLKKYEMELRELFKFLVGKEIQKEDLILWKSMLEEKYSPSSVNGKIVVANGFFSFLGRVDLRMKLLKIQKKIFRKEEKELTKGEYQRLILTAENKQNKRLSLVIQTLCATGIRVSELKYITVEAVRNGQAEVNCKGKNRVIFIPLRLQKKLKKYGKEQGIKKGMLFVTKSGRPLNRSNIWTEMKKLCNDAGVPAEKVFPHNLRHLFATTFYSLERDIAKLADLLGHSSIETTRIYIMESGKEHQKRLEKMQLVL